jgi:ribonuclease E
MRQPAPDEPSVEPVQTGGSVSDGGAAEADASTTAGSAGPAKAKRRRGRRGGKRHRRKPPAVTGVGPDAAGDEEPNAEGEGKPAARPKAPSAHRRTAPAGSRGGRPRSAAAQRPRPAAEQPPSPSPEPEVPALSEQAALAEDRAETLAAMEGVEAEAEAEETEEEGSAPETAGAGKPNGARKRRRRGGRGRGGAKKVATGAEPEKPPARAKPPARTREPKAPEEPAAEAEAEAEAKPRSSSTRLAARAQRRGQRQPQRRRRLSEEEARALRGAEKTMLIHASHGRTQIAVLENRVLIQHYVTRETTQTMVGNIYLGRVQNVIAGMEAAFVDLGRGRNAVLYAGEVNYAPEDLEGDAPPRIEKVLKSGQPVLVQVTKDPIGTKGARLTAQISLAGRYLVLAPEQRLTGISRRLHEDERSRLRQILRDIRPDGHGVIVRTAAEGASKEALQRDLQHLVKQWEEVKKKQKKAKAPAILNEEPELVMRVVRDIFSGDFEQVVVDSREIYERIKSYLDGVAPELLDKLQLYAASLPVFEAFHVTEQIHKALERKVWLPSGGSIVIDRTEAMTVIDVNTGRFVGKGGSLEDTVYKNNLEAAEEVARQLRLRDIGGIILIDFIDMLSMSNRTEVLRTLKRALARDKVRSQVSDEISKLGLVEMTRKRASEGLLEAFSETCPHCEGRGIVITREID